MENPNKIEIKGLKTIHKLCNFGAEHDMEGCSFTEIVERMFSKIKSMQTQVNTLDEMLLNQGDALAEAKAKAVPEGFVLVPKAESTGLTDKNEKLIFVGDVVEFVGGCRDFLDLSGVKSPLYTVNKGDKMIVRKLKSGYTLSLPWIDCDTPNRIGNLGNYDFWNLRRDFIVIEAQEQSHDSESFK